LRVPLIDRLADTPRRRPQGAGAARQIIFKMIAMRRGDSVVGSHHDTGASELTNRFVPSVLIREREPAVRIRFPPATSLQTIGPSRENSARFRASLRHALPGGRYQVSETVLRRDSLADFNDRCKGSAELRVLILQARAAAMNDADCVPLPHRRLEIESEQFVMA
jgi:hypothetical protein